MKPTNPASRRDFITAALSATLVVAGREAMAAAPAGGPPPGGPPAGGRGGFASAPPATDIRTEFRKVGASTWAFLQREAPGQSNFSVSNFGVVAGPKSLLAIDAGGAPQHARNFLAAARTLGKPIDRMVITHEHPDHSTGLTQFPEGIEIIAQEETRAQMARMATRTPTTPDYWKTNPAWGNASDVNRVVMPTMTFRERMSVYYGDTRVDFLWPGRAHTVGDALIFVRSERVVFLGDIGFFGVTPLSASGFMTEWIAVCDAVLADPAAVILVPGHGPVGGKQDLREMRDYLVLLMREGRKAFDAGVSAADAAARIDLGKYATWTDADRVTANMNRLYNEFRGAYDSETDREATRHALAEYARLQAG